MYIDNIWVLFQNHALVHIMGFQDVILFRFLLYACYHAFDLVTHYNTVNTN
jgi:hypothetical protein